MSTDIMRKTRDFLEMSSSRKSRDYWGGNP
jgi:hypothetical protein